MDGRTLEDLPTDIISYEICQWLMLEPLLRLRQTNDKHKKCVDAFIQLELPKVSLLQVLNKDDSHFIYLCNLIKKNPALLQPLRDPEKLLALCVKLKPIGLLRLSIIFSSFKKEIYVPLVAAANSDNANWFIAFICCALLTPNILTLNSFALTHAIHWLALPENKNTYAAIHLCLSAIDRVLHARTYIDISDFPLLVPCYLNLQGAHLSSAKLRRINLSFANLQGADLSFAELQSGRLYGAYIKGAKFHNSHLWDTFFFDLKDGETTLLNQLEMLNCQLLKTEHSAKLDEALTTDLLTQISTLSDPETKHKALQSAHSHPLFTSRLDNINIHIAFTKAFSTLAHPSTTGFFRQPKLRSFQKVIDRQPPPDDSPHPSQ